MGGFGHILEHFQYLQAWGPLRGYLPESTKSILVVAPRNEARAEEFFRGMGVKIVTGSWYLGVFVGDKAAEDSWLVEKVQDWAESVKTLVGVTFKHRQSAFAVLQKSLQQEWAFVQRVIPGIREAFVPVEKMLRKNF